MFLLVYALLVFSSCKKNIPVIIPPVVTTPEIPTTPTGPPPTTDVPADATIIDVGTGSGYLTIDGNTLKATKNALVRIHAGTYKTITIKNILATADKPVFIKNNGEVIVTEAMQTENVSHLVIAGDYVKGLVYGFKFENIAYRAITIVGKMTGLKLMNISFRNVEDYSITGDRSNGYGFPYNGTAETRTDGFKILACSFDNAGSISFGGTLNKETGEDSGLFKDVEIAYNVFQNIPDAGSVCYFSNAQDYNIHDNVVNNVNMNNNNHNGIFFMQGNGNFHHNKLTNYQGNAARMWVFSRGDAPATNLIYDNICYNTRKYSAFELQSFPSRHFYPGKSTFTNARIYNNTIGKMNTSKDWEGQVLDLYNTGGTLEYFNNLGFELITERSSITNMINNMSDTKIIKDENNKYFSKEADAVSNNNSFPSKSPQTGAVAK